MENLSAMDSPDKLSLKPKMVNEGRFINKRPIIIVSVILTLVITALCYAVYSKSNTLDGNAETEAEQTEVAQDTSSAVASILKGQPEAGVITDTGGFQQPNQQNFTEPGKKDSSPSQVKTVSQDPALTENSTANTLDTGGLSKEAREELNRLREVQRQMYRNALSAPSKVLVDTQNNQFKSQPVSSQPRGGQYTNNSSGIDLLAASKADPNMQSKKQNFLENQQQATGYLNSMKQSPVSPYEIKAGTVIPGVMISGINSDLPGQIIAQVSQNVYDSATGKHLLLPQGSKLFGTYSSNVSHGQKRVLVAWSRVNFPDSSSLDLQGMAGVDQAGYAGFSDKVNNHYLKIFGNALLLSVITAGVQLSQPESSNSNSSQLTPQQQVAAALGQQMGQVGIEMIRRNMDIQPTLEIRPGYRFNIMVNKDVILEPYRI